MAVRSSRSQQFCLQHLIVLVGGVVLSEKNTRTALKLNLKLPIQSATSLCFLCSTFLISTLPPSCGHTGY